MAEPKNLHFYNCFRISELVAKPQHQYYLSFETPGYLNKTKKSREDNKKHITFYKSRNCEIQHFDNFGKDGRRKMMKLRYMKS